MMKMNTKNLGILTFLTVLAIGLVLVNTLFAQNQPEQLHQRYQEIKAEAQRLRSEGYNVTELLKLNRQIRQAYQERDFQRVKKLLEDAEQTLKIKGGRETPAAGEPSTLMVNKSLSSPFGVAFGEGSSNLDNFMDYIHDLGVSRTKVSFFWHKIEPKDDRYNWKEVDAYINQLQPGDRALLNVFTTGWCTNQESPKGATFKNEECKEKYREFIIELIKRTNGKITYWQRDTEPASPKHYPANKPEEYVEAQKIFYEAVKSVQPDAIVIGVNANGDFRGNEHSSADFFDYVIHYGEDYFDMLDIRLYADKYDIPMKVEWFRDRMKKYGYEKPIVCTEFGGPDPREFPEQYQSLSRVIKPLYDSSNLDEAFAKLESMREEGLVPPEMDMFLVNTSPELEEKRNQIHCRDLIQRHLIILSSDVKELWYWNLQSSGLHPIFSKMRLMDPEGWNKLPPYYCYQRMIRQIGNVKAVKRVSTENENICLFNLTMQDDSTKYVIWERRDMFHGEDQPPTPFEFKTDWKKVKITDVFGNEEVKSATDGALSLGITNTPLFIEDAGGAGTVPAATPATDSHHYAIRLWLGGYTPADDYLDFIAEHYEFVIVPELQPDLMQALLDRNPDIRLIYYVNPVFTQPSLDYPEDYYAHSSQSTNYNGRVINERFGTYLMDISAEAWRNEVATSVRRAVEDYGYFGVMADDCGPDISHRVDFVPDDYDVSVWQAEIKGMLSAINDRLDCPLIFNGIYNKPEYPGRDLLEVTDGGVREGFVFNLWNGEFLPEKHWKIFLNWIIEDTQTDYHIANAKFIKKNGETATTDERMFAFTSYLLVKNDRVIYSPEDWGLVAGVDRTLVQYYPEMGIDLGEPLQTDSRLDGYFNPASRLYEREFEKGIVLVNPATEPVTHELGQNYLLVVPQGGGVVNDDGSYGTGNATLSYRSVSQVIVPSQSGVIILDAPGTK